MLKMPALADSTCLVMVDHPLRPPIAIIYATLFCCGNAGQRTRYDHILQATPTGGWARVDARERGDRVALVEPAAGQLQWCCIGEFLSSFCLLKMAWFATMEHNASSRRHHRVRLRDRERRML